MKVTVTGNWSKPEPVAKAGVADVLDRCVLRVPEAGGACRLQSKDTHLDFIVCEAEVVTAGIRVTVRMNGCAQAELPAHGLPRPRAPSVSAVGLWACHFLLPPSSRCLVLGMQTRTKGGSCCAFKELVG